MRKLSLSIVVGAFGTLVACTGETGPAGEPGAAGNAGTPGNNGTAGLNALTNTTAEAAGTNCANGGFKIEYGLDANANGTLDASEVNASATKYVCNGGGKNSLVKTSDEPAGTNCVLGGTKIETGLDADGNGTLEAAEVNAAATSYVCKTAPSGAISPSTGVNVAVKSVTQSGTGPITVRFTMKDDRGFPLDTKGLYSVNTAIDPRFGIGYFTKDATTGNVSTLNVLTKSGTTTKNPTMFRASSAGQGTLTENGVGAGDYTYTFPTTATAGGADAVAYDAAKTSETHTVWIQATRQTDVGFTTNANTFYAANQDYNYVPATGAVATVKREIAAQANCDKCHDGFKAETTTSNAYHGGGRVAVNMCVVCHNPVRDANATTPPAAPINAASFIHRIHNGEEVAEARRFDGIAATYPQDVKNCDGCHKGAAQAGQIWTNVTRVACAGCHARTQFSGTLAKCNVTPGTADCLHSGGAKTDDTGCTTGCHDVTALKGHHAPVAKPSPTQTTGNSLVGYQYNPTGAAIDCTKVASPGCVCSTTQPCVPAGSNVNISYVAAAGYVPADDTGKKAAVITYDVKSVAAVDDATNPTTIAHPSITFRLVKDGTPVVFQTFGGSVTEIMAGFVGSPSVYFAWAVPQDGIAAPVDFNQSASAYIKNVWNGVVTASTATMTFDAATGYYTITLVGTNLSKVAATKAVMLTGGVGYSYNWTSSQPLTQTDFAPYPYDAATKMGGIAVPGQNVWKVASGFTARRAIVDNAKCLNCHGANLGVNPTFHAGQRNDGPTCSFCHTPNRTSSAWSAGSKYFIHAIHAGRKRAEHFTWHAMAAGPGYGEIEFPGTLNGCTTCHSTASATSNTYDYTASASMSSLASQLYTTVATGKYNGDPATNSTYYTLSPYVKADNTTDYGKGFSTTNITSGTYKGVACSAATPCVCTPTAPCEAEDATLVLSPITGACSACHDSKPALAHMKANGGLHYASRAQAMDPSYDGEQCMMCHGPGRVAAVGAVHQR